MKKEEEMADDQRNNRKRMNSHDSFQMNQIPRKFSDLEEDDNDLLTLSLSFGPTRSRKLSPPQQLPVLPQPPPPPLPTQPQNLSLQALLSQPPLQLPLQLSPSHSIYMASLQDSSSSTQLMYHPEAGPSRQLRVRRNPTQAPREGKSDKVPPPYPWATDMRATVHSLEYLLSEKIYTISGQVGCKRCERNYPMEYDLREKFVEVGSFIVDNKNTMHDRAPSIWMNPILPTCKFCKQENSVKPIISDKKKSINWLFLLLGQLLGCCTLEQLKYFCKHTKNHRTGAKDRVLYLTYLGICKQLDPNGPFHHR